ncbi:MAG: glycosyltransferase [Syntrophobacteraceae bacterium]
MPAKILFCEAGVLGGSVNRLTKLLTRLNNSRFQPSILTYYNSGKAKELHGPQSGFHAKTLGVKDIPAPDVLGHFGPLPCPSRFGIRYLIESLRMLIASRPDLVYLNNTPYCHLPMILAASFLKVPIVCHLRDTITFTRAEQHVLGWISKFVVLSLAHKDFYRAQGIPGEKIVCIYNGIDPEEFDRLSCEPAGYSLEDAPTIAFTAVMSSRKRWADAVKVLRLLVDEMPDVKMLFLGDGPDREALEAMIHRERLQQNAILTGTVSNVAPCLPACKAGLMLSEREGMPNVILEYMAAALPVIATNLPGISEMVQDGITGHLVPLGQPESVSKLLKALLEAEQERTRMGNAGRALLESRFSLRSEVECIERLLADVI